MLFLQQWHLPRLVLWLALRTRFDGSQEISFKMQDNILVMFPSVWVLPLGNLLLCCMYEKRFLSGCLQGDVLCSRPWRLGLNILSTLWENSHGPPWLLWEKRNVNQKLNSHNFVGGLLCYAEYLCVCSCLLWLWEKSLLLV